MKEKRELSKKVVQLNSTLESSKNSSVLLKEDQAYNAATAVITAKREERKHFSTVVKTHKDSGRNTSMRQLLYLRFFSFVCSFLMIPSSSISI